MEYRKLGLTDLEISRIGFGCWGIGGHGYGRVDDRESIRAVHQALDLGINLFDTADVYGFGHSEEVLCKALGKKRHGTIIATKFGVAWDDNGNTFRDSSPKRAVQALEASLRRLKIDCVPLYQIHWHDGFTPIAETMEALNKCKEDGKLHYIGCTNFSVELVQEAVRVDRIESLQCLYNIRQREAERDMLECHKRFNMGIMAYGVLRRGLFSGKYGNNSSFDDYDTRGRSADFHGKKLSEQLRVVKKLQLIGSRHGMTSAQVAIRFVLDNPLVACAIVGHKTAEQVIENTGVLNFTIPSSLLRGSHLQRTLRD